MNFKQHNDGQQKLSPSVSAHELSGSDDERVGGWRESETTHSSQRHKKQQELGIKVSLAEESESSSLSDLVTAVRSQMQRCSLPPFDVAAIEKYIISVLHRSELSSREEEGAGDTGYRAITAVALSLCSCTDKVGYSSPGTSRESSPANTRPCTVVPRVLDHGNNVTTGPLAHTSSAVVPFGVHSRHALLYASVYSQPSEAMYLEWNTQDASAYEKADPHSSRNGDACEGGENGGMCSRKLFVAGGFSQITGTEDGTSRAPSAYAVQSYEAAVTDILRLRRVLSTHEAEISAVLVAVNRREALMSKLRYFLNMASEDCLTVFTTNALTCEIPTEKGASNDRRDIMPSDSSRSGSIPPCATRRGSPHAVPLRPLSSPMQRVVDPSRNKVHLKKCRYYRSGVLYLLRELQRVSVEVVENVCMWRRQLSGNYPFVINNCNYLLKMAQEMAALSQDLVLQFLFPSPAKKTDVLMVKRNKHGALTTDDCYQEVVTIPGSLQFYPLITNMPHLTECHKPVVDGDFAPFDFDVQEMGDEVARGTPLSSPEKAIRKRKPRVHSGGRLPLDVVYARRVYKAEDIIHREVAVQLQLLKCQFLECARGRYPLVLRGVGELSGSRDGMLRLRSRRLQREWHLQLCSMLSCLEEGSSAIRKE